MSSNGTEIRNSRSTLATLKAEIEVKGTELQEIAPRVDALKSEEAEVAARIASKKTEEVELDELLIRKKKALADIDKQGVATSQKVVEQNSQIQQNHGILLYQAASINEKNVEVRNLDNLRVEIEKSIQLLRETKAKEDAEYEERASENKKLVSENEDLASSVTSLKEEKTSLEGDVSNLEHFVPLDAKRMEAFAEETGYIVGEGRVNRKKNKEE